VSIKSNKKILHESISDEENEDEPSTPPLALPPIPQLREEKSNLRSSMERLDTQVSTLHQDVATLSIEVRNAIQALQEMATYTTFTHVDSHPARSIPNLQNGINNSHHIVSEYMTRSSSQPAEIWHRSNQLIKSISDLDW
jgi:hypothetical protein